MSRAQLVRLTAVLAVALVLWGGMALLRQARQDKQVSFALPKVDTASVDTIRLTSLRDTVALSRAPKGAWRANTWPADSSAVSELLRGLADSSAWGELVAQSRTSHAQLGVTADSGRRLQVTSHGRMLLDVTTGKQTSDFGGVYVRRNGEDAVYALHGALGGAVNRSPDDWRDKHIARVMPDSVTTIEVQQGTRRFTVTRSHGAWMFGSGRPADSAAVANLLGDYRELSASAFATRAQADSADFRHPTRRTRLGGANGTTLVSLVFDSTANAVWARPDSGGTVFRLDAWTMNRIAPAESTLAVKKKR